MKDESVIERVKKHPVGASLIAVGALAGTAMVVYMGSFLFDMLQYVKENYYYEDDYIKVYQSDKGYRVLDKLTKIDYELKDIDKNGKLDGNDLNTVHLESDTVSGYKLHIEAKYLSVDKFVKEISLLSGEKYSSDSLKEIQDKRVDLCTKQTKSICTPDGQIIYSITEYYVNSTLVYTHESKLKLDYDYNKNIIEIPNNLPSMSEFEKLNVSFGQDNYVQTDKDHMSNSK